MRCALVVALLCALSSSALRAQSVSPNATAAAAAGQSSLWMDEAALRDIVAAAGRAQAVLKEFSAEFRVDYQWNLVNIGDGTISMRPHLAWNNGLADGVLKWTRVGEARRLELRMNVPRDFMRSEYEDRIFVDDGQMQVQHFVRTGQTALGASGTLASRTPEDWLLPGSGLRRTFDELAKHPSAALRARWDNNLVRLFIDYELAPGKTWMIGCTIDPAQDFAVTQWDTDECGRKQRATISYTTDSQGRRIPAVSEKQTVGLDGSELCAERLTLLSVRPVESIGFEFLPGMTFTDSRARDGDGIGIFRVRLDGSIERINSAVAAPNPQSANAVAAAGTGAIAIALAVAFRYLRSRKIA